MWLNFMLINTCNWYIRCFDVETLLEKVSLWIVEVCYSIGSTWWFTVRSKCT